MYDIDTVVGLCISMIALSSVSLIVHYWLLKLLALILDLEGQCTIVPQTQSYYTSVREALFGDGSGSYDDNVQHSTKKKACERLCQEIITSLESVQVSTMNSQLRSICCAICINQFEFDDHLLILFPCGHIFHRDCILQCLERYSTTTCPICRQEIQKRPSVSHHA